MGVLELKLSSLALSLKWVRLYSILILNPQCKESASDVNVYWRTPIKSHDGHIGMYFYVKYNDSDWMIVFTIILLFRLVDPLGHSFSDLPIG